MPQSRRTDLTGASTPDRPVYFLADPKGRPDTVDAVDTVDTVGVLMLADTHIGFDWPLEPRTTRRLRGPDFRDNMRRALAPALRGEVDLVVHGGDLFHRSQPRPGIVDAAFAPLLEVADAGVDVIVVPGNHERSQIPCALLLRHPRIHIISHPRTVVVRLAQGCSVALGGFPFLRDVTHVGGAIEASTLNEVTADIRLLCVHQTVAGATVGPSGYVFRRGRDVIAAEQLPHTVAAVLSGHIHRAQVLRHDLSGTPLPAPVVYPGSTGRTSFAERSEDKGYRVLHLTPTADGRGRLVGDQFNPLPSRPMLDLEIGPGCRTPVEVGSALRALPADAIVRVSIAGRTPHWFSPAALRATAPATMSLQLRRPRPARSL